MRYTPVDIFHVVEIQWKPQIAIRINLDHIPGWDTEKFPASITYASRYATHYVNDAPYEWRVWWYPICRLCGHRHETDFQSDGEEYVWLNENQEICQAAGYGEIAEQRLRRAHGDGVQFTRNDSATDGLDG